MTKQEKQDFIDKVKGKKVRWSTWPKSNYFIPNGIFDNFGYFEGKMHHGGYRSDWVISCGFKTSGSGGEWSFWEEEKQELSKIPVKIEIPGKIKCTCPSQDLFRYGCKCGYSGK